MCASPLRLVVPFSRVRSPQLIRRDLVCVRKNDELAADPGILSRFSSSQQQVWLVVGVSDNNGGRKDMSAEKKKKKKRTRGTIINVVERRDRERRRRRRIRRGQVAKTMYGVRGERATQSEKKKTKSGSRPSGKCFEGKSGWRGSG